MRCTSLSLCVALSFPCHGISCYRCHTQMASFCSIWCSPCAGPTASFSWTQMDMVGHKGTGLPHLQDLHRKAYFIVMTIKWKKKHFFEVLLIMIPSRKCDHELKHSSPHPLERHHPCNYSCNCNCNYPNETTCLTHSMVSWNCRHFNLERVLTAPHFVDMTVLLKVR